MKYKIIEFLHKAKCFLFGHTFVDYAMEECAVCMCRFENQFMTLRGVIGEEISE